jgi:hypothetical protein
MPNASRNIERARREIAQLRGELLQLEKRVEIVRACERQSRNSPVQTVKDFLRCKNPRWRRESRSWWSPGCRLRHRLPPVGSNMHA